MSSMRPYSRILSDADRALTAAEQAVIDRSCRTVTDTRVRRAVFRLSGGFMSGFDAPLFGPPTPGQVLSLGRWDRILVVSSGVEVWDQDRVDDQALAPDGEPDAGEFVFVTGVTVAVDDAEARHDERQEERDAVRRRRAVLDDRIRALITTAPDRDYPGADDPALSRVTGLSLVPRVVGGGGYAEAIYVDPEARTVWLRVHNGRDGDGWALNNAPGCRVWRMPLTAERAALIADLRGEYELDSWLERGFTVETAAVFIAAGWSAIETPMALNGFRIEGPEDARLLLARTPEQWRDLGWNEDHYPADIRRFSPADAVRLGEAGITCAEAIARYTSGHTTVEDIIAARAPQIPATATRVYLRSRRWFAGFGMRVIIDDATAAQQYLDRRPGEWDCEIIADDARIVHATEKWALCETVSGGLELVAVRWIGADTGPNTLSPVAEAAITTVVDTRVQSLLTDTGFWRPVLTAIHHQAGEVDRHEDRSAGWSVNRTLIRHQYTFADGNTVTWWELGIREGGMVGGEGESYERSRLYTSETAAWAAFRTEHP